MVERKAKFIRVIRNSNPFDRHAWEHTDLLYVYRDHEYIVTKHNNGYAFDSLKDQHEREQKRIDDMLDNYKEPIEWKYEGSADEGFDIFWDYVTEGEQDV